MLCKLNNNALYSSIELWTSYMYTLYANLDAVNTDVEINIDYPHPHITRRGGCGVGKILHNPRDICANLRYWWTYQFKWYICSMLFLMCSAMNVHRSQNTNSAWLYLQRKDFSILSQFPLSGLLRGVMCVHYKRNYYVFCGRFRPTSFFATKFFLGRESGRTSFIWLSNIVLSNPGSNSAPANWSRRLSVWCQ